MSSTLRPQHAAPHLRQTGSASRPAGQRLRVTSAVATAPRLQQPTLTQLASVDDRRPPMARPTAEPGDPRAAPQPPLLTPKKLQQLAAALQLDVRTVQSLAHDHPAILILEAHAVYTQLHAIEAVFGATREQAVLMIQLAPWLLLVPPLEVSHLLQRLVVSLGLPPATVQELCRAAPAVLRWEPAGFRNRLAGVAEVLDVPLERAVLLGIGHTQLLRMQRSKVAKRLQRLVDVFALEEARQVQELAAKEPRLLTTSTRIIHNKMKVIQSVLDGSWPLVAHLVLRKPQLVLTVRQDNMRAAFEGIQRHLPCPPTYALQMVRDRPRLLLMPWHVLEQRIMHLHHVSACCARWAADWDTLDPYHAAQLLDSATARHSRLRFLLDGRMAHRHGLASVMTTSPSLFHQRYPGYHLWLQQQAARGHAAM